MARFFYLEVVDGLKINFVEMRTVFVRDMTHFSEVSKENSAFVFKGLKIFSNTPP
jgi:hypothetical protein